METSWHTLKWSSHLKIYLIIIIHHLEKVVVDQRYEQSTFRLNVVLCFVGGDVTPRSPQVRNFKLPLIENPY